MVNQKNNQPTWKFENTDDLGSGLGEAERRPKQKPITWLVSESIFDEKSIFWYLALAGCAVAFAGIIYFATKDLITTGIILFCAAVFGYYAGHKPHPVEYTLDDMSIRIGQRTFRLNIFKSFFMVGEDRRMTFVLIPQKRFSPGVTFYSEAKDADKIAEYLSQELPLDKNREDTVDRFLRKINF